MDRKASAIWKGSLREGNGTMSTESGVLEGTQYSFRTRFERGIGTNPDELIAASLGGCFSMALSNQLGLSGLHAEQIDTTAIATLARVKSRLDPHSHTPRCSRQVPNASQNQFIDAALTAKTQCPIARLLNTVHLDMTATLNS